MISLSWSSRFDCCFCVGNLHQGLTFPSACRTEEMRPEWCSITEGHSALQPDLAASIGVNSLPFDQMVARIMFEAQADETQWPEAFIYFQPLMKSVLQSSRGELVLGRIDYAFRPVLSSSHSLFFIRKRRLGLSHVQYDGVVHSWWSVWWMTEAFKRSCH